jgi:two-component system phosphate regulon sensor histidine kinase PhoR
MLNVSTYLVSVLDPNELLTSLARRVVEVVPAVQAGLLWLHDQQHRSTASIRRPIGRCSIG